MRTTNDNDDVIIDDEAGVVSGGCGMIAHMAAGGFEPGHSMAHDHVITELNDRRTSDGDKIQDITEVRKRVVLNLGGHRFVTYESTLTRIPESRLALLACDPDLDYDPKDNEYFFDRNPTLFPYILDGYRHGFFHFPHCMCTPSVKEELDYWGIKDDLISPCCWKAYKEYDDEEEAIERLDEAIKRAHEMQMSLQRPNITRWERWKTQTLLILDEPYSGIYATVWSWLYAVLLGLSLFLLVLGTEPACRVPFQRKLFNHTSDTNPKIELYYNTVENPYILNLSRLLLTFFLVELILRFVVWPSKCRFLLNFFNLIDTLSIVPLVAMMISDVISPGTMLDFGIIDVKLVLSVANVFRMLRILKIINHNRALRVLVFALRASMKELLLLTLLVAIGTLIFSTTIYYAEFSRPDAFFSIPQGFWWSIITMTTVGYGDVYPVTIWGYMVGAVCAMTGMLIAGLPIPIIANNFNLYYTYAKLSRRMETRKVRITKAFMSKVRTGGDLIMRRVRTMKEHQPKAKAKAKSKANHNQHPPDEETHCTAEDVLEEPMQAHTVV